MASEDAFRVEGVVVEALPNGTYCVELPNGHKLLGFVTGQRRFSHKKFESGHKVRLQLSPYDLSEGRIILEKTTI
jgi:translation initiation factor IF-1